LTFSTAFDNKADEDNKEDARSEASGQKSTGKAKKVKGITDKINKDTGAAKNKSKTKKEQDTAEKINKEAEMKKTDKKKTMKEITREKNENIIANREKNLRKVLEFPHINALIADSFWYIICKFFKLNDIDENKLKESEAYKRGIEEYTRKKELLLDRLAANFVSFFINYRSKQKFIFKVLSDLIAQAVFFSLFFAYPKSRSKFDIALIFDLLREFAGLFNGPRIRCDSLALISHWRLDLGTGDIIENLRQSKI